MTCTSFPKARNNGSIRFNASSDPEGNTVNSPEEARTDPPETGASTNCILCGNNLDRAEMHQEAETVEVTTMTAPGESVDARDDRREDGSSAKITDSHCSSSTNANRTTSVSRVM